MISKIHELLIQIIKDTESKPKTIHAHDFFADIALK